MASPGSLAALIPPSEDDLPRSIKDIQRFLRELPPSIAESIKPTVKRLDAQDVTTLDLIADLAAQDVTIIAQQATLTAQQSALADVVANQVSIDGKTSGTTTGVVGVGAYTTMLQVTLTAPVWATRAVVTCSAVVGSTSMGGAAAGLWGRITVDGVASESFEYVAQTGGETMSVTPLFLRVIDPGASVVVNLDTRATFGSAGTALARLVASVSYTR